MGSAAPLAVGDLYKRDFIYTQDVWRAAGVLVLSLRDLRHLADGDWIRLGICFKKARRYQVICLE